MYDKINSILDNFSHLAMLDTPGLPPNRELLGGFTPDVDDLKRDALGIVNQLQNDGSLDGGDSAHRTGVLSFCNSATDQALLQQFESDGIMVRHPAQVPWNNWKNCSRDQLFGFISGCWRAKLDHIVHRLFREHKDRFPPYTCQNTEADYDGTTKFPPIGDPLGPHDIMYFKICSGDDDAHKDFLGQFALQLAIELASKDLTVEKNQLLLQSIVCGRLNLFVEVHSNYKESLRDYWSGWRQQPQIAEALIKVVDLELTRYASLSPVPIIAPLTEMPDVQDLNPISILNYIKASKIDLLNNQFIGGLITEGKDLGSQILDSIQSLISARNDFIKNELNKVLPPVSTGDVQYSAIKKNLAQAATITPHVGAIVSREIIVENILAKLKADADKLNKENIVVNTIEPAITLKKQILSFEFKFDFALPKYHLTLRGRIGGVSGLTIKQDKLLITNALDYLEIENVSFSDRTDIGDIELSADVSLELTNYIENLNSIISENPVVIDLAWQNTYKFAMKELARSSDTEISGEEITVSRFVKNVCLRVDETGLASLVELSNEAVAVALTPENSLPGSQNENSIDEIFAELVHTFDAQWSGQFEPISDTDLISVSISKNELSRLLNEFLSHPLSLKQRFLIPAYNFDQAIEVTGTEIDCQDLRTNFDYHDFNYPDFNYPDFSYPSFGGWDCMIDSGWPFHIKTEDPFCVANREAARISHDAAREFQRAAHDTARETARAAHDVARDAARSAYNLERESKRLAHQTDNEAKIAACNMAKEVSISGFLALGRFSGSVSAEGRASITLSSVQFNSELSEVVLRYSGQLDASVKSNLNIAPVDLGYLFLCFANYSKEMTSVLDVTIPEQATTLTLTTSQDGENLNLDVNIGNINYETEIEPSPLHVLFTDPALYLTCPSFAALIGAVIGVAATNVTIMAFLATINQLPTLTPDQTLLLTGKARGSYEVDMLKIPLKPIDFMINEKPFKSQVQWKSKSIQFLTVKV